MIKIEIISTDEGVLEYCQTDEETSGEEISLAIWKLEKIKQKLLNIEVFHDFEYRSGD